MFKMSNETYDFLKNLTMKYLPAVGAFYSGLAVIWGLPYASAIDGTILLICTLLGTCLGISTNNYNAEQKEEKQND